MTTSEQDSPQPEPREREVADLVAALRASVDAAKKQREAFALEWAKWAKRARGES